MGRLSFLSWVILLCSVKRAIASFHEGEDEDKSLRICSVAGGLNIVRFFSSETRNFFRGAIEDVELIREYISEAAFNKGIVGGMHDLWALNETLDWEARNMTAQDTTVSAGIAYSDDRKDRRVERYVGLANEPYVGSKTLDMALIDPASNIFPWIVDRKSNEDKWYLSHQNGRSNLKHSKFDKLYTAAWIGTRGEAWLYYPPLQAAGIPQPFGFGDVLGPRYDSREEEFVKPNLPENNRERKTFFTAPYPDTASPGLSLITAQAPVFFDGEFQGTQYDDVYIASTGVDISVASISSLLDTLEGTLTEGSFAFLVSADDFQIVVISQQTVEKIYPQRTGFEEARVVYDTADGSVLDDRRNQTYLVSDTLFQDPRGLDNANWTELALQVKTLAPGERGSITMNVTLTGDIRSTEFIAMYERWPDVADWALVVCAPREEVDNAIDVQLGHDELNLDIEEGSNEEIRATVMNNGKMDVTLRTEKIPQWLTSLDEFMSVYKIAAGSNLTFRYMAETDDLSGLASGLIAFTVTDDSYPDCFYEQILTMKVGIKIVYEEQLNQLDRVRPYGFVLAALVMMSSIGCSLWVLMNDRHRVVRTSQPVFLHMMCSGIFLMGLSIITMGIDDSLVSERGASAACMAVPWLLAMGFSISFSALFSKIWRINQIVSACKNYRRVHVSVSDVLVPFFVICSLNWLILSLWTGLDPLVWTREPVDTSKNANENESVGSCGLQGGVSMACLISLLVVNFVAVVLALIQLYRARKLSTEYSEGKYIAIAMGSAMQVFLTGLPVIIVVDDNPQLAYLVDSSIVFVVAFSFLLLTFVPKFLITAQERAASSLSGDGSVYRRKDQHQAGNHDQPTPDPFGTPQKVKVSFRESGGFNKDLLLDRAPEQLTESCSPSAVPDFHQYIKVKHKSRMPAVSDLSLSIAGSSLEDAMDCGPGAPLGDKEARFRAHEESPDRKAEPARRMESIVEDVEDSPSPEVNNAFSNATVPTRAVPITPVLEDSLSPKAKKSLCNAPLPVRAASIVEDMQDSPLSTSKNIFRNATLPVRAISIVEDEEDAPSLTAGNAFSNASQPVRAVSIVEDT